MSRSARVRPCVATARLLRASQAEVLLAWIGVAPDDNAVTLREPPLECDILDPARRGCGGVRMDTWNAVREHPPLADASRGRWGLLAPRPLGFLPSWADAERRLPQMWNAY